MAASTGKAAIVCCGLGMLRCSEIDFLLILYCVAPPANVLVSFWYTMELAVILAVIWGAGWRNAAQARAGPLRGRGRRTKTLPQRLRDEAADVIGWRQWPEAWNGCWIGKIPLVLGNADEITNGGIDRPGAAQRRLGQLRRHAGRQKSPNVTA